MKKYPYIWAWGKLLKSYPNYIEGQVAEAEADNAPDTATYKKADGEWSTFEDIQREDTRQEIEAIVKEMEGK